jgi:hypothetical protein
MNIFLDSSALVKRYFPEQGSRWVRSLVADRTEHRIIIAQITPIEVVSGISRRKREGAISPPHAMAVRQLMKRHLRDDYLTLALTESVASRARDLLEQHSLRAYDAVQLAAAIEGNTRLVAGGLPSLIFVSADRRLLNVAGEESLTIEDPEQHE